MRTIPTTTIPTARTGKPIKAVLLIAMLLTAAIGLWLIIAPSLDKHGELTHQNELLESLEAVSDTYVEAAPVPTETAFYPELAELHTQDTTATKPPVVVEPIADTEFPDEITGLGILSIEKIGLRLPVAGGVDERTLKIAPCHVTETAVIGDIGNAVIAGHRAYTYGEMFNRLGEITGGDIIEYKEKSGEVMRFEVFEITEINPGDQIAFIQPADEAIITLYTCTPIRTATHRLLVRARLLGQ